MEAPVSLTSIPSTSTSIQDVLKLPEPIKRKKKKKRIQEH